MILDENRARIWLKGFGGEGALTLSDAAQIAVTAQTRARELLRRLTDAGLIFGFTFLDTSQVDLRCSYHTKLETRGLEMNLLAMHLVRERPSSYNNCPHKAGSTVAERESSWLEVSYPLSEL
jgi:hypothetical protein